MNFVGKFGWQWTKYIKDLRLKIKKHQEDFLCYNSKIFLQQADFHGISSKSYRLFSISLRCKIKVNREIHEKLYKSEII